MTLADIANSIFENKLLTDITIAIIILLVGFIIGKLLGKLVSRVLHELEVDELSKKTGAKVKIAEALGSLTSFLIYFIAVVMALDQLGIKTIILYIIAVAVIIFMILAMLLGIKDFIPNMFAGFFVFRKKLIKKDDWIMVHGVKGKIEKINLVETTLKTKTGDTVIIPNSTLMKEEVIKLRKR